MNVTTATRGRRNNNVNVYNRFENAIVAHTTVSADLENAQAFE